MKRGGEGEKPRKTIFDGENHPLLELMRVSQHLILQYNGNDW